MSQRAVAGTSVPIVVVVIDVTVDIGPCVIVYDSLIDCEGVFYVCVCVWECVRKR